MLVIACVLFFFLTVVFFVLLAQKTGEEEPTPEAPVFKDFYFDDELPVGSDTEDSGTFVAKFF